MGSYSCCALKCLRIKYSVTSRDTQVRHGMHYRNIVNGRGQDTNSDYKNIIITDNMDCPGIMGVYPDICSKVMLTTRTMTCSKGKQVPRSLAFSFSMRMSNSCWLMAFFQSARSSSLLRFTGCCFGLTAPRPLSAGTQQTGDSIRNVTVVQTFHL